jgi:hypothetical protein
MELVRARLYDIFTFTYLPLAHFSDPKFDKLYAQRELDPKYLFMVKIVKVACTCKKTKHSFVTLLAWFLNVAV